MNKRQRKKLEKKLFITETETWWVVWGYKSKDFTFDNEWLQRTYEVPEEFKNKAFIINN